MQGTISKQPADFPAAIQRVLDNHQERVNEARSVAELVCEYLNDTSSSEEHVAMRIMHAVLSVQAILTALARVNGINDASDLAMQAREQTSPLAKNGAASETPFRDLAPVDLEFRLEHTDARIRGYLAAVRHIRGLEPKEAWSRGRAVIERIAVCSVGYGEPIIDLTPQECADALVFVEYSEPIEPERFFAADTSPCPQTGLMFVLRTISRLLTNKIEGTASVTTRANSDTCRQIVTYLGAVRTTGEPAEDGESQRARELIQRLALNSVEEDYPTTKLTLDECAQIVDFARITEPRDPKKFFSPASPDAQRGFLAVLGCVTDNLRAAAQNTSGAR
jgi:hypothetical protein